MTVLNIAVVVGSTRAGRQTPKVARALAGKLKKNTHVSATLLDLGDFGLPMLTERLKYLDSPPEQVVRFGNAIAAAHAVVLVSPEYNSGYPGVLKNAIDSVDHLFDLRSDTFSEGGLHGIHAADRRNSTGLHTSCHRRQCVQPSRL